MIRVGNLSIGHDGPCRVVAEIGAMYEDLAGMQRLIDAAVDAKADAVKIQTYRAETISNPEAEFEFEDGSKMSQYEFFRQYEISDENHRTLFDYARKRGILIFSTPSDYDDVDFLEELDVPVFKTGSDDLTNLPFLEYIADKGRPMIVSTGMSTLAEVDQAVRTILKTGNEQLILLHCTVSYPPERRMANLKLINTLKSAFALPVGYSDHIPGILSGVLAAALGACMLEKHVTLDRSLRRPDYQVSLEPHELKKMVEDIRAAESMLGETVKRVFPSEEKWRKNARKSLVAAKDLAPGSVIGPGDIKIVRPGTGIPPSFKDILMGRTLKSPVRVNEMIGWDTFM